MSLVVYLGQVLKIKVRVDLGRRNVRVPQQLLNTAQILTGFEQMRRERVTEGVAGRPLLDAARTHCVSHRPLEHRLVHMMPPNGL